MSAPNKSAAGAGDDRFLFDLAINQLQACPPDHPLLKKHGAPRYRNMKAGGTSGGDLALVLMSNGEPAAIYWYYAHGGSSVQTRQGKGLAGLTFDIGSTSPTTTIVACDYFSGAKHFEGLAEKTGVMVACTLDPTNDKQAASKLRGRFPNAELQDRSGNVLAYRQEPAAPVRQAANETSTPRPAPAKPSAYDASLAKLRAMQDDGVVLTPASGMKPEPVEWIWRGWIAAGKVMLLAGAPGQGKTTIAMSFAASVSTGGVWPDGSRAPRGDVLIWTGEDDPADTLVPRLMASGADLTRIHFVSGTRRNGETEPFDPSRDMAGLAAAAAKVERVKLIIVDPLVSAITGDSHKNAEVRRGLQPVSDLASILKAGLLGITHFSKGGQGGDPTSRVIGSVAFSAVARVVMVAAKSRNERGEDCRILARSKSNIGPDGGGFTYEVQQSEPAPGVEASFIEWLDPMEGTATQLLADPSDDSGDEARCAIDTASDFLRQALSDGPAPTRTVQAEARDAGVSWASVRRAADGLGVLKRKSGNAWIWSLPTPALRSQLAQGAQGAQVFNVEQVEQVAQCDGQVAQGAQHSNVEQVEQVEQVAEEDREEF